MDPGPSTGYLEHEISRRNPLCRTALLEIMHDLEPYQVSICLGSECIGLG